MHAGKNKRSVATKLVVLLYIFSPFGLWRCFFFSSPPPLPQPVCTHVLIQRSRDQVILHVSAPAACILRESFFLATGWRKGVSWHFEPSQPLGITSGLTTGYFNLIYIVDWVLKLSCLSSYRVNSELVGILNSVSH